MNVIHPLLRGAVSVCLLASLLACASKGTTRTETVEIRVPVYVPVPGQLTEQVAEPVLAADATNADLADWADALKAALREANSRLREVAGLQPAAPESDTAAE